MLVIKKYRESLRSLSLYKRIIIDTAHNIYNLKYSILKEITVIFHNGSNYDHHFIIKELAEEFEIRFTC